MKLITVIIPTIGRDSLANAIDSVWAQAYQSIELIICNDSGRDLPVFSSHFLSGSARSVRILSTSGGEGACVARNLGIYAAKGEYITFLDDDDEMLPDYVSGLLQQLRDYRLVAGQVVTTRDESVSSRSSFLINGELVRCFNYIGNSLIAHTEDVRSLGGFDVKLPAYQDYDLWVRLIDYAGPCLKVHQTGILWNYSGDTGSITNSPNGAKGAKMFIDKHYDTFGILQLICQNFSYKKYLRRSHAHCSFFDRVLSGISKLMYLKRQNGYKSRIQKK
jgi:glycosyltransferase involved in cell wall biosynthesis